MKRSRKATALSHWAKTLGPGIVVGAADDDPSGITTYSISGATTGYSMLWTALFTVPMMAVLMGMCARIGLVTGEGLVASMKRRFPRPGVVALVALVVSANTLNIAADYAGMGATAHLIAPLPAPLWIATFAVLMVWVEIFFSYRLFAKVIKWLCLSLLAYVVTAFLVHPPWPRIFIATFIPHVRWDAVWLTTFLGVLGTTVTPYLFFWQASQFVEEERELDRPTVADRLGATPAEIADMHEDVNTGMVYSNLMTFFIIVTTAATLGAHRLPIATAEEAAVALRPLAGDYASLLFMLGIVGTGLLAIPVLAGSSAYAVGELAGSPSSLGAKPRLAPLFYGILTAGLVGGFVMALLRLDVIKLLYYSAVFNGIAVVPLIYCVVRMASSQEVLGRWVSSAIARAIGWLSFWFMLLAALAIPASLLSWGRH